jgi:hypothetical protein
MQSKKKVLRALEGKVHAAGLGRLTDANLPSNMYPGTTRRITTTTLGTGANLPGGVYVEGRGNIHGMTPRNQRVIDPLRRKRLDRI